MKSIQITIIIASLIIGASVITASTLSGKTTITDKDNIVVEKPLMNIKETADYLSLSEDQVKFIIEKSKVH